MVKPIAEIEHTIDGVVYTVRISSYEVFRPASINGIPENCYPAEGGVGEFTLHYDGEEDLYLQQCLSLDEEAEIQQAIFDYFEGY